MKFSYSKPAFQKVFHKGDFVVSTWNNGYCQAFFVVGTIHKVSGSLFTSSPIGIDCSGNIRTNGNFGIEDNDIRLMTPEEKNDFLSRLSPLTLDNIERMTEKKTSKNIKVYSSLDLASILEEMASYIQQNGNEDTFYHFEEIVNTSLFENAIGKVLEIDNGVVKVTEDY